jgi:hypothetical protein
MSGCLPHSFAPPLHLRIPDFRFWLDGKIVHRKLPS